LESDGDMVKTAAKVTNLTYAEFHCGVGDPFFNTVEFGGRRSDGAGLLLSASTSTNTFTFFVSLGFVFCVSIF
jgi:hypothetical protein